MMLGRFAAALLTGAAVLTGAVLVHSAATAADSDVKWLFIQTAQNAQFDGKTLTLKNVGSSVVMFTDRPARMAKVIPTAKFLASWNQGGAASFQSNPPNAGVTSIVDGKLQAATVELSQPHLDGTTLTYRARVLDGTPPANGAETSIFFDDIHWNPGGF